MTKAQKQAGSELIREFMNSTELMCDYYSLDKLDAVISKIQTLDYSYVLGSLGETITAAFVDRLPPYNTVRVDKAKTRVEAVFQLVTQFITQYEPRPDIPTSEGEPKLPRLEQRASNLQADTKRLSKFANDDFTRIDDSDRPSQEIIEFTLNL